MINKHIGKAMPKVSVIVPCFNVEKYIERCLNSLQKQLLEDIEIICIDDKSTDNTLEILKSRAESDSRIHVIAQEKNMGVAVARNTGIDNATGEYVGFVDADDYVDIDFYQKIYNHAIKTGAELAKGLLTVIENGSRFIPPTNEYAKQRKIRFCYDFTSAIYKKDFLDRHNLRFMEGVALGEDITFLIKAAYLCNELAFCPYPTSYYYEIRSGSANTTMDKNKINSIITIVDHMMNYANTTQNMPQEDYNFIIWFVLDVLGKNLAKVKFEDKHILEQSVYNVINVAKDKKYAKKTLCTVFGQLYERLFTKYIPNKNFLKIMKKYDINVYKLYAEKAVLNKNKFIEIINIVESQAFKKIKLFGAFTIYKKYKGNKPIENKKQEIQLVDGKPKVSIVVPFYNVEKYIGECMESLVNQTLKDIEIICVDDCGSDNSRQIVENFAKKDTRIKIIKNRKNRGLSYSRNVGIKKATAPYIMFCDSDDMLKLDACEKMMSLVHLTKADIAACSMEIKYESDTDKKQEDEYLKIKKNGLFDINKQFQFSCNVCAPAKIYKREIIIKNKIEFPVGLRHEDEFFFPVYCIWAKKIAQCTEELYVYRRRQESIMNTIHNEKKLNLDPMRITERYIKYCKKMGVWAREKLWVWYVLFPSQLRATLRHSGTHNSKKCFKFAKKCIRRYYNKKNIPIEIHQALMSIKNKRL